MANHIHIHLHDDFEESKHPRGEGGKFGAGSNRRVSPSAAQLKQLTEKANVEKAKIAAGKGQHRGVLTKGR